MTRYVACLYGFPCDVYRRYAAMVAAVDSRTDLENARLGERVRPPGDAT